jgi:hypothetical protein
MSNIYFDIQQYANSDAQACSYNTTFPFDIIDDLSKYYVQVSRFQIPSTYIPIINVSNNTDYTVKMKIKSGSSFLEYSESLPLSNDLKIYNENQYLEYINRALYRTYIKCMEQGGNSSPNLIKTANITMNYDSSVGGSGVEAFSLSGFAFTNAYIGDIKFAFSNITYTTPGVFDLFIKCPSGNEYLILGSIDLTNLNNGTFALWDGYNQAVPCKPTNNGQYQPSNNLNLAMQSEIAEGPYQILLYPKYGTATTFTLSFDLDIFVTQSCLNIYFGDVIQDIPNKTSNLSPYLSISGSTIKLNYNYNFYNSGIYIGCSDSLKKVFNFPMDSDNYIIYDQALIPSNDSLYKDNIYMSTIENSLWGFRNSVERIIIKGNQLNTVKEFSDNFNNKSNTLTTFIIDPSTWSGSDYFEFNINYARFIEFLSSESLRTISIEIYYKYRDGREFLLTMPKDTSWSLTLQFINKSVSSIS